ncbi:MULTISPECIES: hypothetical protein [unclassified Thermosynechococcus]|uniref:hypothetical protein n=1 Tax=unclassified Thermosynechococcus TaxID=2622553 RepID=UPI002671A5C9|nr:MULTISPECIES: hypothetical protein [unclassified Thermosynechococcus]MDR5638340.1 hypothetical protein [Thermosynechococcus sp. PP42]MDR7921029.1 hypothetical protein [Thermosynechococcus sp. HY213]MDR7992385.1 hypothetical protein [Thermosynechococcus sp. TG252]WKT81662.1 hypothetical protein QYC27_02340 [Thermosynechococcus sp. PP45]WNC22714.1 hypothetical protein RHG98_02300 [Thermosynechococcus sp. PP22]
MQVIRYIRYLDSDRTIVGQIPPPATAAIQPTMQAKTALRQDHTPICLHYISEKGGILESISHLGSEGLQR